MKGKPDGGHVCDLSSQPSHIRVISIEVEQGKTISLKGLTSSYFLKCLLLHVLSIM
jgi:hypothetical protein